MTNTFVTRSAEETHQLAARIGLCLEAGDVLLLEGDLGAGKTTFTQGLAQGLLIGTPVTSPTFTLAHEYLGGRLPLFHFDPYRLSGPDDILDLGFEEYLERGGVVVVEWAERLGVLTPAEYLQVRLETQGQEARCLTLTAVGDRYETLLSNLIGTEGEESGPC